MRVAILGAQGQLGRELSRMIENPILFSRKTADITDATLLRSVLMDSKPDAIVNCSAYTAVDLAESNPTDALAVNGLGPRTLAQICEELQIPLVHISTDYVFGAEKERSKPYEETEITGPINVYGSSKLLGETFVRSICSKHFILRTCGLYGHPIKPGTGNFVETMIRLSSERDALTIVDDQFCTPTSTFQLASLICELLKTEAYGLYHATCSGEVSWFELANAIFDHEKISIDVSPISTKEFGAPAARPAYSVLNCDKLKDATKLELPDWKVSLHGYLNQRAENGNKK